MQALIVEDDRKVAELVADNLRGSGFQVDVAWDGQRGMTLAQVNQYDVIVLDLILPGRNGLEIVGELRRAGNDTPILFLTQRTAEEDIARGLNEGADDYLAKPFRLIEFQARVRALVRRGGAKQHERVTCGAVCLDRLKREVHVGDVRVDLTPREFDLLEYLMLRPEVVVRRAELLEQVWRMSFHTTTRLVDSHVSNLRGKLRRAGAPAIIETVPTVGFRLQPTE